MMSEIRTGILSFGMSGQIFHAPFLDLHHGFELSAVVERTKKQAATKYPSIRSYDSVDEILADDTIELIVVNTPNATHFDFALRAIQAKKHVLVEKPFATTSLEAKQLYEEAKKNGVQVFPYHNRRYDSDFQSVKQMLNSGKLGELVEAHIRFDRYKYGIGEKKAKEIPGPGAGLLYDLGPHILDQALSIFGKPARWEKRVGHFRPHTQVDDFATILLSYPSGLQVFVSTSLLVADPQPAFILHGTLGSYTKHRTDVQEKQLSEGMKPDDKDYGVELIENQGILTTVDKKGVKTQERVPAEPSTYMNLFEDVYQSIKFGKMYPVKQEEIIEQLEILES